MCIYIYCIYSHVHGIYCILSPPGISWASYVCSSCRYYTLVSARIAIEIGALREALNTPLIDIFMRAAAVLALLLTPPGLL